MIDFLQMQNKLSGKKRKEINKSKQTTSLGETGSRKAITSILNSFDEKKLPTSISAILKSEPNTKNIDITIIDADVYCTTCCLKRVKVFAVFMRNIQYLDGKETKAETNLKIVIF